jgi:choline kinase
VQKVKEGIREIYIVTNSKSVLRKEFKMWYDLRFVFFTNIYFGENTPFQTHLTRVFMKSGVSVLLSLHFFLFVLNLLFTVK